MTSRNKANLTAVIGSTGSGKSLWIKRQLKRRPSRLIVWDPMREYGDLAGPLTDTSHVIAHLATCGSSGGFTLVFQPSHHPKISARQFDLLCSAAMAAGRCTLIAEELASVTRAGYSPPGWLRVVTQGRHAGLTVIGTTQRPALIDKTFLDNATTVRCGRLNTAAGRRYMADLLDVPADTLAGLKPLEWVSKDMSSGKISREKLTAS
jgi:hypothetical protein